MVTSHAIATTEPFGHFNHLAGLDRDAVQHAGEEIDHEQLAIAIGQQPIRGQHALVFRIHHGADLAGRRDLVNRPALALQISAIRHVQIARLVE
ncbi:conserved hypothetical protein, partial [Ricinus communis]